VNGATHIYQLDASSSLASQSSPPNHNVTSTDAGDAPQLDSPLPAETFQEEFRKVFQGGETVHALQMLNQRFLALLNESSPQLYIYDMRENRVVSQVAQPFTILNCQSCLNGAILCVVSENQISVHLRLRNDEGEVIKSSGSGRARRKSLPKRRHSKSKNHHDDDQVNTTNQQQAPPTTTSSGSSADFYVQCLVLKTGPNPNALCSIAQRPPLLPQKQTTQPTRQDHNNRNHNRRRDIESYSDSDDHSDNDDEESEENDDNDQDSEDEQDSFSLLLTFPSVTHTGHLDVVELSAVNLKKTHNKRMSHSSSDHSRMGSLVREVSRETLKAHESSIRVVTINNRANVIATASERGTVIRLFKRKAHTGPFELWKELKRGTYQSGIYCINFSSDSKYLCSTSSSGTLHIFDLWPSSQESSGGIFGYLVSFASSMTSETSLFKMHGIEGQSICCFNQHNPNVVYVVTKNGQFMECTFDYSDKTSSEHKFCRITTFTV